MLCYINKYLNSDYMQKILKTKYLFQEHAKGFEFLKKKKTESKNDEF